MCKSERFLTVLREHIIFNVKWVDIRKTSEVFWSKLYCKMSDIFRYFLLALRLSTWKSENLKKSLMTSTGTCGRIKKYTRNNIFKKRIPNMRFWIIYILVRVSFLGTVLRNVFSIFRRRPTMVVNFFNQPPTPHHEKASYGPVICS